MPDSLPAIVQLEEVCSSLMQSRARHSSRLNILTKDGLISTEMSDKGQRPRRMPVVGKYVKAMEAFTNGKEPKRSAISEVAEMKGVVHRVTDAKQDFCRTHLHIRVVITQGKAGIAE